MIELHLQFLKPIFELCLEPTRQTLPLFRVDPRDVSAMREETEDPIVLLEIDPLSLHVAENEGLIIKIYNALLRMRATHQFILAVMSTVDKTTDDGSSIMKRVVINRIDVVVVHFYD